MSMPVAEKKHLGRVDADLLGYLKKDHRPLTCISLFTGCGGAALGIRLAGFEIRAMVEWDKNACKTLRANWIKPAGYKRPKKIEREKPLYPGDTWSNKTVHDWYQKRDPAIIEGDITKIPTEEILMRANLRVGECTLLEGGFPCQGFSMANSKRGMHDERNFLYQECVRVIREAMPKTFLLENVPGLVSMEKGAIIRMICDDLAASGYQVSWDIHNAADYGVPQHRRRVIIMGSRNDLMRFKEDGTPEYHIGGAGGPITHPAWFLKKYPVCE